MTDKKSGAYICTDSTAKRCGFITEYHFCFLQMKKSSIFKDRSM